MAKSRPKSRPSKTSVDYVVIGLSPLLIMVLVGSLCFFLLEVFYRGDFAARLHWILFWFVIATVGIARISMEEGSERASVYSLGLVAAVAIAVMQFLDSPWVAWALMGVVWWCAHKLTWDCTLIDDDQDASGEGLLQVAGLEEGIGAEAKEVAVADDDKPKRSSWWQRLLESPEERRKRPHAPGVWVVYFSLAALPLFGLGQAIIPSSDMGRRQQAFWLLVWYVASGMGLLLTTSFLGLRRYLRQRKLEMPTTMTGAWLGVGAALIVGLILATMLVPRPNPEYPVEELVANAIRSPLQRASKYAVLRDSGVQQGPPDAAQGTGSQTNPQSNEPRQTNQSGSQASNQSSQQASGSSAGGQQSGGQQKGEQSIAAQPNNGQPKSDQTSAGQQQDRQQQDKQSSGQQPTRATGSTTPSAPQSQPSRLPKLPNISLTTSIRWLMWLLFAVAAVIGFLVYRKQVMDFLRRLWAELQSLINELFGRRKPRAADRVQETHEPSRPFAEFRNPFHSGQASRTSPEQLVRYTFNALEAWAFERRAARRPEDTPLEFADGLNERFPAVAKDARQLARLYSQMLYARANPTRDCLPLLQRVWDELQRPAQQHSMAELTAAASRDASREL